MTDRQGRLSLHRLAAAAVVAAGVAAVALALPEGRSDTDASMSSGLISM